MNTSIKTAIIWARTSSSGALETRQSTTRQVEDLQDFAARNHYQVENIFEEHISGRTAYEHRAILSSAINYAKENHIHMVAVSDQASNLKYLTKMIQKKCGDGIVEIHCHAVKEVIKDVYGGIRYEKRSAPQCDDSHESD